MLERARRWLARFQRPSSGAIPISSLACDDESVKGLSSLASVEKARRLVTDGDIEAARRMLERSAQESPEAVVRASANAALAVLLQNVGEHLKARELIERALRDAPDDADLNYRAGVHALAAGEAELALDLFRLCRHYDPERFSGCAGEAKALQTLGREAAAGEVISSFLDAHPGHDEATFELSVWRYGRGEYEEAMILLEPLAKSNPIHPEACNLLGLILGRDLGRVDEAIGMLERALVARPGWIIALCNLGWMHSEAGRHAQGLAILDDVLLSVPGDPEARLIRGYMNLKHGNFSSGWLDYGARHESRMAVSRPYHFPQWDGKKSQGASLLIFAEQGLGDHLMFSSCVGDAAERVAKIFLECHPELIALFKRSFPFAHIVSNVPSGTEPLWLEQAGSIDMQIAMGDLPTLFRNNWAEFPAHFGYLRAAPDRVAYWRDRLNQMGPGLKVGLSWRGGVRATRRQLRSIPPSSFAPLYQDGVRFVSLQYGDVSEDIVEMKRCGLEIAHWPEAISDYDETAALVCALDQVVSVCTAVIHLCGALGRPIFVLVPKVSEWRYLFAGDRLPWYPTVQLIRQKNEAEWKDVIGEVRQRLEIMTRVRH